MIRESTNWHMFWFSCVVVKNMRLPVSSQASPVTTDKGATYEWLKAPGATRPAQVAINEAVSAADGSMVPVPIAENDPRVLQSEPIGSPSPQRLKPARRQSTEEDSLFEEEKAARKQPEAIVEVRQWRPFCFVPSLVDIAT